MNCPKCNGKSRVIIGALSESNVYLRRRICKSCGYKFMSEEKVASEDKNRELHIVRDSKYK